MELSALRDHPFVTALGAAQLERIVSCARAVRYEQDAFIFREGDDADTVFLIVSGTVALEQHIPGQGVVTVESLSGGDLLGLSWLFRPSRWTLDARAVEPVQGIALRGGCVLEQMAQDPALGAALLTQVVHALYQRLIRVRLQRLDVYQEG